MQDIAALTEEPIEPGLYLVPTPLGHLEDITLRALRVLRQVDLILAEDTRRTRVLLDRYQIRKPCEPYHDFNKEKVQSRYLQKLSEDGRLALVSDAGTPGIADPAFNLVRAALNAKLPVHSLPGPVALTTALIASGLPTDRFFFDYFPAKKSAQRLRRFESLRDRFRDDHHAPTLVYYISPYQVLSVVEELSQVFGSDLHVVIGRELTKKFEEYIRGTAMEVAKRLKSKTPKGEFVLMFHPGNKGGTTLELDDVDAEEDSDAQRDPEEEPHDLDDPSSTGAPSVNAS
jgi:16S rRNA (cytidine1402-2'-O)-methyltransferase